MNKKYLMKSMAALALMASVSSCVSDVEGISQAELDAAAKENAELQLGITIPDGQTWDMSAQVSTDITVNLGLDQSYTVGIYDVDPRFSKKSTFYALEKVNEGGVLNTSITLPNAMKTAYIAVYDSNLNLKTVSVASVTNGAIVANVGGTAGNRAMRGVFTDDWSKRHECKVSDESKFEFKLPSDAVDVTSGADLNNKSKFYVPAGYEGEVSVNLPNGGEFYNYGTITALNANYNGTVTIYNAGTITDFSPGSGGDHTVINIGNLTIRKYSNIGVLYNGGALVLGGEPEYDWSAGTWPAPIKGYTQPDIPDDMHIYSNGNATIEMPNGGDFKAVCDIHGTITVPEGNLNIQNGTWKYVCGIDVQDGDFQNVDGPLETSYIHANTISFDGNPIYLLPQGYIKAENTIKIPNDSCHVYAYENSYALVEATNFEFGNENDFTHTFTNSIKFNVSGYVKVDNCYEMGQSHYFNNVNEYLADVTHNDEFALAKDRINLDNVYGTSECGGNYGDIPEDEPGIEGDPAVYTYAFEDQYVNGDYDMNDVVLKVSHPYTIANGEYNYDTSKLDVKLVAAGATFNIKVKIGDTYLFSGKEIHEALGVNAGVMVNTGGTKTQNGVKPATDQIAAPADWDGDFNNLDVKIEVLSTNDVIEFVTETPKVAPYSVMIPTDWAWPTERTNVMTAYKAFKTWAEAETRTDAMNRWYETPETGLVVTNQ